MPTVVQDQGYAWAVCAASFLIQTLLGGLIYSAGVLYIMLQDHIDAGDEALSFVTSLNQSMLYLVCIFVGLLTERFGERCLAIVGSVMATIGLVCSSFSTKVYHLYLAYSITTGLGMGMMYNPCMTILAKYFSKHCKIATGLSVSGACIGSMIFPPIIKALEDAYGWRGAILILAGFSAQNILFSSLLRPTREGSNVLRHVDVATTEEMTHTLSAQGRDETSRIDEDIKRLKEPETSSFLKCQNHVTNEERKSLQLPRGSALQDNLNIAVGLKTWKEIPSDSERLSVGDMQTKIADTTVKSPSLLKIIPFLLLCIHSVLVMFCILLVYTHFGRYILSLNYTKQDVMFMYMTMGIGSTIVRVLLGIIAEVTKVNCTIVVMLSAMINGIITLILPFIDQLTLLYGYTIIFCIMFQPYNAFCFPIIVESVPFAKIATAHGIVCFFCVPGVAFGAPVAAWLHGMTLQYTISFYLAGVLFILSGLVMVPGLNWKNKPGKDSQIYSTYKTEFGNNAQTSC